MFENLLNLVTRCAVEYKFKAAQSCITEEAKERYTGYANDFELLRKEIKRLDPIEIVFKDGQFVCPKCGGKLDMICDAAEEYGEHLNFCSWCGQAIEAYGQVSMECEAEV